MSKRGKGVTVAGNNLLTKLFLSNSTLVLTRAKVGQGILPENTDPRDLTDLIDPLYDATTTAPVVTDNTLALSVQYRNDMHGGLQQSFWIREYGIYAEDPDEGEILLYYGSLGDYPDPAYAYQGDGRVDSKTYPILIILSIDTEVELKYIPGAYVTEAGVRELIEQNTHKIYVSETLTEKTKPGDFWYEIVGERIVATGSEIIFETSPYSDEAEYALKTEDYIRTIDNVGDNKDISFIIKN